MQVLGTALALALTQRLLPAGAQRALLEIRTAVSFSFERPLDWTLHARVKQFIVERLQSMQGDPSVWLWLLVGLMSGAFVAWFFQMLMTGLHPAWRYTLGAAAGLVIASACVAIGNWAGALLVGSFAAVAFGPFAGWVVVLGLRNKSDRQTDARTVRKALAFGKAFDPLRYMRDPAKKGMFFGIDAAQRPVYVPLQDARKHLQLVGETRTGKTVAATLLLSQCAALRETVVVLDPKVDVYAPRVMQEAARRAGVPFVYLDLRPDQSPQLSLLHGASASEIEELLIDCFDLRAKGTDADVYRVEDRAAARRLAASGVSTFAEMVVIAEQDPKIREARKFMEDLRELAAHPVADTKVGLRLGDVVSTPCVLYIAGSTRHDNTIRLQKLVLMRLLQLLDRKRDVDPWTAIFLDEFKYLLSPSALAALGTSAHRRCHLIIAHQSNGDLRDCAGLDSHAVYGAVVVNTGLKLIYKTNDPDTAQWAANLSGDIRGIQETIGKNPAASPGSFTERRLPLIDRNVLLALPQRTGMLFGAGIARLVHVHPLPASSEAPAVKAASRSPLRQAAHPEDLI